MLYLNSKPNSISAGLSNLTLTSVVFEFEYPVWVNPRYLDLTLTSVVFELFCSFNILTIFCYLTLTSVVFELMEQFGISEQQAI